MTQFSQLGSALLGSSDGRRFVRLTQTYEAPEPLIDETREAFCFAGFDRLEKSRIPSTALRLYMEEREGGLIRTSESEVPRPEVDELP